MLNGAFRKKEFLSGCKDWEGFSQGAVLRPVLRKEGLRSHFFSICLSREQMAQEWREHRSS